MTKLKAISKQYMRKAILFKVLLLSSCFGIIFQGDKLSAQEWKLRKNNNDIKVYSAKGPDSKFDIIKVEASLQGTIQQLKSVLKDVNNNKKWVYKTKRSFLVDSVNSDDFRYYAETGVPWPFSNRDMVIRMQFMLDSMDKKLQVKATGVPQAIPENNGLVRIKKFDGLWEVRQEGNDKLRIDYLLSIDPGGSIPAGLSNLFLSNGPFETFNNLAKLLKGS